MKAKLIFCFIVIAILFAGQALAKIAEANENDVKALTSFANESGWQSLIAVATKNGAFIDCESGKPSRKCVTYNFLTKGMYVHASRSTALMGLVNSENRTEEAYTKLVREQNGMPAVGGAIPVEDLKELVFSPDRGIFYARVENREIKTHVAQAQQEVVRSDAPANAVVQPAVKPEVLKPSEAEVQIGNLQKQVAEMKKALAGNVKANERLIGLEKQLKELAGEVDRLGGNQTALAKNQAKISNAVDGLRKDLTDFQIFYSSELIQIEAKVDNTYSGLVLVHGMLNEAHDSIVYNMVIPVVAVMVFLALFFWFANRKTRRIANEANAKASLASADAKDVRGVGVKVGLLIEEVNALNAVSSDDVKGLTVYDEEKLHPDRTMQILVNEALTVIVNFGEQDYTINFYRSSQERFHVYGVKRSKDALVAEMDISSITNFVNFIRKAYRDKRIVGTVQKIAA